MINYLTLFTAFVITCVAEYFSIIGLTTIFVGAFYPVIIMGVALALGKIVATSWLYRNWYWTPVTVKYYLIVAIIILMTITTLGTFGYLSRAHVEHTVPSGENSLKISALEEKLLNEKQALDTSRRQLKRLDDLVDQALIRSSTETGVDRASSLRRQQRVERNNLLVEIEQRQKSIETISSQIYPLQLEKNKQEAELGPLKYVAELIYGDSQRGTYEKAVRFIIILIAFVLDPLAIALLIAFNHSATLPPQLNVKKRSSKIELDKKSIFKL